MLNEKKYHICFKNIEIFGSGCMVNGKKEGQLGQALVLREF